jgi:hypothetical protein
MAARLDKFVEKELEEGARMLIVYARTKACDETIAMSSRIVIEPGINKATNPVSFASP